MKVLVDYTSRGKAGKQRGKSFHPGGTKAAPGPAPQCRAHDAGQSITRLSVTILWMW